MQALCTICTDLMCPVDSIYVTKCGHIFHHQCLAQWIRRSTTCPQCRNTVTTSSMFRLYPTLTNESEDLFSSVQSCLENLKSELNQQKILRSQKERMVNLLKVHLKKKEDMLKRCMENFVHEIQLINKLNEENKTQQKIIQSLNRNLISVKEKLAKRDVTISALKERLVIVNVQILENCRLKEENETLKKNSQALCGNLSCVKQHLANRESVVIAFKEKIKTLKVQIAKVERLKEENEVLRSNLDVLCRNEKSAKETLENRNSAVMALKLQLKIEKKKIEEINRLKKENEALMQNIQDLEWNLSSANEKLSRRDSSVLDLEARLKFMEEQNRKSERLNKDLQTLNRHYDSHKDVKTLKFNNKQKTKKRKSAKPSFPFGWCQKQKTISKSKNRRSKDGATVSKKNKRDDDSNLSDESLYLIQLFDNLSIPDSDKNYSDELKLLEETVNE